MCDNEVINVDKFEIDLQRKKIMYKGKKETKDLRKWFDEEIGYDVLDKHHF